MAWMTLAIAICGAVLGTAPGSAAGALPAAASCVICRVVVVVKRPNLARDLRPRGSRLSS
jgi:hypothetical protein